MKISLTKEKFLNGLQLVNGVVGSRTTLPILSNLLLKGDQNKIWLTATDLELSIRASVEAEVQEPGVTTLPARRLLNVIRELPSDNFTLEIDEKNNAAISCGSAYFKILGLAADEFPILPQLSGGYSYTIDRLVFKDMLQKTAYAASTDEMRYILNGNLLSFKGEKLVVVTTDGRRLALAEQEVEFPKEAEADVVVPTKTVMELMRALQGEGPMKIHVVDKQVAFEFGDILLVSKLIEGQYPNYRQVIPGQCEQRVAIDREILLNAIRRVSILASDKATAVKLTFGKNKLTVAVSSPDVGEAHESLPIKYTGKETTVSFNGEFLMDPLRNLANDEVFFEIIDELSPGVVKCDSAFIYVIMPMRVN